MFETDPGHAITPKYILKRNEDICPYKNVNMNVQSSIFHNTKDMQIIQILTDEWRHVI